MFKHIFWDMDGTLVDSELWAMKTHVAGVAEMVRAAGKVWRKEDEPAFVIQSTGSSVPKIFALGAKIYGILVPPFAAEENERHTLEALAFVPPTPGIGEVLDLFRNAGRTNTLVTSSKFDRIRICLAGSGLEADFPLDRCFSAHDSLPLPKTKPDPAIYLHAIKETGADPKEILAVEDSPTGARAAVAAGLACVGYLGGSHVKDHNRAMLVQLLKDAGVVAVIHHHSELPGLVRALESCPSVDYRQSWSPAAAPVRMGPAIATIA